MMPSLSRAVKIHVRPEPSRASASPPERLAGVIEVALGAVAAAALLLPAADAGAQVRIIPLVVRDPNGPDFGPVDAQNSGQIRVGPSGGAVAASIGYKSFEPVSAADVSLIATLGPGGLIPLALPNTVVAGQNEPTFFGDLLRSARSNGRGQTVFVDLRSATGESRLWRSEGSGEFVSVARYGQLALADGSNTVFRAFTDAANINSAGSVAFGATYQRDTAPISSADNGVWVFQDGVLTPVARTGNAAAGLAGKTYFFDGPPQAYLSDSGRTAFVSFYADAANPLTITGHALWEGPVDNLQLVFASGTPAPAPLPAGTLISSITLNDLRPTGVMGVTVGVPGGPLGIRPALMVGTAGNLSTVVAYGQTLPGAPSNQTVDVISRPSINDRGEAAFVARTRVNSPLRVTPGVWRYSGGQTTPIVLGGAPSGVAGISFANSDSFAFPVINARGEVIFSASMSDGGYNWVWFAKPDGTLRPLVRPGDSIPLPDGRAYTVVSVQRMGSVNAQGWIDVLLDFGAAEGSVLINPRICDADFDASGSLDADDLSDYITCYFAAPPCNAVDFNGDGDVNPDDLGDFITAYFTGC